MVCGDCYRLTKFSTDIIFMNLLGVRNEQIASQKKVKLPTIYSWKIYQSYCRIKNKDPEAWLDQNILEFLYVMKYSKCFCSCSPW